MEEACQGRFFRKNGGFENGENQKRYWENVERPETFHGKVNNGELELVERWRKKLNENFFFAPRLFA